MAKFTKPSSKATRLKTASSGAYSAPPSANNSTGIIKASNASVPLTRNAQFAGAYANFAVTQPMFFSPMHTPQNWQIASKRGEIYNWSFIDDKNNPCYISNGKDFSLINIGDIFEDQEMYIGNEESEDIVYIQNGNADKSSIDKATKRFVKSKANKIKIMGVAEHLCVTENHNCMIIKKEDVACYKSHNSKKCVCNIDSPTCRGKKCSEYIDKNYEISKVDAKDIRKGDYVLVPFNMDIKDTVINTIEEARFAGHLASDGGISPGHFSTCVCMNSQEINDVFPVVENIYMGKGKKVAVLEKKAGAEVYLSRTSNREVYNFASSLVVGKHENKKFTEEVCLTDPELQLHVLGAYIQSDGHYNKINKCVEITTYSPHLSNQLMQMFYRCGILARVTKQPISSSEKTFSTKNTHRYIINIPSSETYKIKDYVPGKIKQDDFKTKGANKRFFWKNYVVAPVVSNTSYDYEGYVYDIREPLTNTIVANGISIYQCRFYFTNEAKVAAGVDFYSQFSINSFKLECKSKKVLRYFQKLVDKIELPERLNQMSHEYFLLGDVFPFVEIECKVCNNSGVTEDGEVCPHPDGTIGSIKLMNPDYIDIVTHPLEDRPKYYLIPDEELKQLVQRHEPQELYDRLPGRVKDLVANGSPIPLSNRAISHLKYGGSYYTPYGTPMLQRLFTILAYKTKMMTANWITAERLIIPIRIVKVGDKDRPAVEEDLQDISNQLAMVANDPNLTVVTHHAIEIDWVGPTGKIHNISQDLEYVGKEILDGLMLNQALLNGEAASYASSQVGVETLIRRLNNWRNKLKKWVENHIFLPVAMMQGFIDEKESEVTGSVEYLYPRFEWEDLQLRDKTAKIQTKMQLMDKGIVSPESVLEDLDLDYDIELQKIRQGQVMASATGQIMGGAPGGAGGFGNLGTMGMGGLAGGPPPGGDMGGPPMGGDMMGGPPMGGDMGGVPGGAPGAAASQALPKITKKGHGKHEEPKPAPMQQIRLTSLEQKVLKLLQAMNVPTSLFAQYQVKLAGQQQPYLLDFAYPEIGVGLELDGSVWHDREDFIRRDQERDMKLASVGWRILRFKEDAIDDNIEQVRGIIHENIVDAIKDVKKRKEAGHDGLIKIAEIQAEDFEYSIRNILNNKAQIVLIGTKQNV